MIGPMIFMAAYICLVWGLEYGNRKKIKTPQCEIELLRRDKVRLRSEKELMQAIHNGEIIDIAERLKPFGISMVSKKINHKITVGDFDVIEKFANKPRGQQ